MITPFFMGTVVGAIASGEVPAEGNGDAFSSWLAPLSLLTGAMFVATGAYLSAVFLVGDARRAGDAELERYFVRRALAAGAVAGVLAAVGLVELHAEARYVFDRLVDAGAAAGDPLGRSAASACWRCCCAAGRRPIRARSPRGAVVAVIWGWAVAQFPYLLPTSLRIDQAAAPDPTLTIVFIVFGVAAVLVLPSLFLLYTLSQRTCSSTSSAQPR